MVKNDELNFYLTESTLFAPSALFIYNFYEKKYVKQSIILIMIISIISLLKIQYDFYQYNKHESNKHDPFYEFWGDGGIKLISMLLLLLLLYTYYTYNDIDNRNHNYFKTMSIISLILNFLLLFVTGLASLSYEFTNSGKIFHMIPSLLCIINIIFLYKIVSN